MSRGIAAGNVTHIQGDHVHEVLMAQLEFSTPVYAHTGFGTISWSGNSYLGVGDFAGVSNARESEHLAPETITLELSGIDSTLLAESLNSGNHGDEVTLWGAYRNDDGSLAGNPWIVWQGTLDFMGVVRGDDNKVSLTAKHHLAMLSQKSGGKFSDEDQQLLFAADVGLEHAVDAAFTRLLWGQKVIGPEIYNPADNGRFFP